MTDIPQEPLAALRAIVVEQAEDEGLWFVAQYASEAYLQSELRRLHAAVEAISAAPAAAPPILSHIGTSAFAWGVSRVADNDKAVLVCFRKVPTDDDMRLLHEALKPAEGGVAVHSMPVRVPAAPALPQEPVAYRYKDSRDEWRYVGHPPSPGWEISASRKHEPLYALAQPVATQSAGPVPADWRPFGLTLAAALDRGDDARLVMDENSPLRAELRRLVAAPPTDYDHGSQATSIEAAARDVHKWLNERPCRPIDLRHVAMLVSAALARTDAPAARPYSMDEAAAVEFYRLNPSAAVLDFRQRIASAAPAAAKEQQP